MVALTHVDIESKREGFDKVCSFLDGSRIDCVPRALPYVNDQLLSKASSSSL
jgi:hypothetical protein